MTALPEIVAAAGLVQAGMSHRELLRSTDEVEVMADIAIAQLVNEKERANLDQRNENLAIMIGNRVGSLVGNRVGEALREIARAMRS